MSIKKIYFINILLSSALIAVLASCSSGGNSSEQTIPGGTEPPESFTSFEIMDPTPGADNRFGNQVIILDNGNILVSDPLDSSVATENGAVHLFDPSTQTLLGSVYGDNEGDRLGLSGGLSSITVLANNNYIVSSRFDDVNGVIDAGSVRLISGETGTQIGMALAGDNADDGFGFSHITVLANSNYVLLIQRDDVGGVTDAGSVRLINGATGTLIGDVLVGDTTGDFLTSSSITALENNNYVVAAPRYNVNGVTDVGSVWLMDGATATQIGSTLVSDNPVDNLGSVITALPNNNYVVASNNDAVNGLNAAGSVRLMNGTDASQIGTIFTGNGSNDKVGERVTALANSNYVIISSRDNVSGEAVAGSVRLMDGATGAQINAALVGETATDTLGGGGVIALANNNYVVISPEDNIGSGTTFKGDVGSVRLMNGSTGVQIGVVLGDNQGDNLGFSGVTALTNNNYIIRSERDEVNGIDDAGSVRLISGTTGAQIGTALAGNNTNDRLGAINIAALMNGNYVVPVTSDDGFVRLMNGTTGMQIGSALDDALFDPFNPGITALANSNYVVILPYDDVNGIANTGSVQLMNGATGEQIGDTILGTASGAGVSDGDLTSAVAVSSDTGNFYILAAPGWDNNDMDAGLVRLIAQ